MASGVFKSSAQSDTDIAAAQAAAVAAAATAASSASKSADTITDGTTNKAYTATEKTKLAGVATGATANSSDATLLARANHTGTESADVLTDGTTNKAFLATERTKLTGIATGATANSADATLLARANHTGTESADVLTDGTTNKAFLATERTKLAAITGTNTGDQTLPVGGTPAVVLGTANAAGVSPNFLRRDDTILAFDATVPVTQAYGDTAATGSATVAARRDHKHAMPATTKDTTAVTGLLKGNGTVVSAAAAGTDYAAAAEPIGAAAQATANAAAVKANNLSDLASAPTARTNLGLRTTKRCTLTTGSANATFNTGGGFDYMQRIMVTLPVTTKQWRIKVANKNSTSGSVTGLANFGTVDTMYLLAPTYITNARWQGDGTSPVLAASSMALPFAASGADATSSFVTVGGAQFQAHTPTILSIALTATAGGSGIIQNDTLAFAAIGGSANVGSAAALGLGQSPWVLDIRIEYDADVTTSTPVGFVCTASDGFFNPDFALSPCEGWPGQLALMKNHLIINGAEGGTSISDWTSISGRPYTRLDTATTVPDYAILGFGPSSNFIGGMVGGDTATAPQIATALAAYKTAVSSWKANMAALGIGRCYIETVPPRNYSSGGSFESLRAQMNVWIRSMPIGLELSIDTERPLRNMAALATLDPLFAASDGVHLTWGGEQAAAVAASAVIPNTPAA